MAGMGDIAGLLAMMQRNKALREDRRQFDKSLELREAELEQRRRYDEERLELERSDQVLRSDRNASLAESAAAQRTTAELEQERQARAIKSGDADTTLFGLQETNILFDTNDMLDADRVWTGIESNDATLTQGAFDILNYGAENIGERGLTPEGFSMTDITPTRGANGETLYVISGEYKDGKRGVLTREGLTGNDETVQTFTKDQITHMMNQSVAQMKKDAGPKWAQKGRQKAAYVNLAESGVYASERRVGELQTNYDQNENAVVSAIATAESEQGTDRQGSRAMLAELSSASNETERQRILLTFADEYGIELPYREEAEQAAAGVESTPRNGRSAASRAQGVGRMARAPSIKEGNESIRRENLPGELADARADLAEIEARLSGKVDDNHPALVQRRNKIRELEQEAQELGVEVPGQQATADSATTSTDYNSVDYAALEARIDDFIGNMSPENIAVAVEKGDLKFTEAEKAAAQQRLESQGITTAQQLTQAPTRDQFLAWAIVASESTDPNIQRAALQNIQNLSETGIGSFSAKDLAAARTAATNADATALTARINLDKHIDSKSGFLKEETALDEINAIKERQREGTWSITNPLDVVDVTNVLDATDPSKSQHKSIRRWFNINVNQAIADAANEPESMWGGFIQVFGSEADVDPSNFRFENVRVRTDDKNAVKEFYYVNPNGKPAGQPISPKEMLTALGNNSELFQAVSTAAVSNTDLKK